MTLKLLSLDEFREYMIEVLDEKIEEMYFQYVEDNTQQADNMKRVLEMIRSRGSDYDSRS